MVRPRRGRATANPGAAAPDPAPPGGSASAGGTVVPVAGVGAAVRGGRVRVVARPDTLGLWMNGVAVGTWSRTRSGSHRLQYAAEWLASPLGRPLSLSLPLASAWAPAGLTGDTVRAWFENLLPENAASRARLAAAHGVDPLDAMAMLGALGRDCVGAIQLLPPGEVPALPAITGRPLDEPALAGVLRRARASTIGLPAPPPDDPEELRLSAAGMVDKTALLRHAGQWWVPHGATPSTHLLKLPLGQIGPTGTAGGQRDFGTSVWNEWACLAWLREVGLDAAEADVVTATDDVGMETALAVTRFDRRWMPGTTSTPDGAWLRLPQEDGCQAFGLPPTAKYEKGGGPGIDRWCALLMASRAPIADVRTFVLAQLAYWLLAAIDGHAKNFSLRLEARGGFRLAPLYDVVSAWPAILPADARPWSTHTIEQAMAFRTGNARPHAVWAEIQRYHVLRVAERYGGRALVDACEALVARADDAMRAVAAAAPSGMPPMVLERITTGVARAVTRWNATPATRLR